MPFKKGQGGRPTGAKNRTTVAAKEAIAQAAEGLGGITRLIAWAKSDPQNERAFWTQVYPRLVPHEVSGPDGGPISLEDKTMALRGLSAATLALAVRDLKVGGSA